MKDSESQMPPLPREGSALRGASYVWVEATAVPLDRFICPACGMGSNHPKDIEEGYCGACHAFTGRCSVVGAETYRRPAPAAPPRPCGDCGWKHAVNEDCPRAEVD